MADNCVYRFGEWSAEEWFDSEFLFGYLDCSKTYDSIDCNNLFIFSKPFAQSQREIDYNILFNLIKQDLLNNYEDISDKESIDVNSICDIYFGVKTKWLIDYLLLFKEELKNNPTVDNYNILFKKYKISCVDSGFKKEYNKDYLKKMMKALNLASLINLGVIPYQYNTDLNKDPLYYIANI